MYISINPSYKCNLRCNFCYLTKDQLTSSVILQQDRLRILLKEITQDGYDIEHVDLYGGEIGILPNSYVDDIFSIIHEYYNNNINIITNFVEVPSFFLRNDVDITVSYDFNCRSYHRQVLQNILTFPNSVRLLILASPCIIRKDVHEMIQVVNHLTNVISVEIKPYSTNQANQHDVTFQDFEEFVKKWINSPILNKELVNTNNLEKALSGQTHSFSDNHLYITPNGKYGMLEFDKYDNELFVEMDNLSDVKYWNYQEQLRVRLNKYCTNCEFVGRCLSEHLRNVTSLDTSCNGFRQLLRWYKDERMED